MIHQIQQYLFRNPWVVMMAALLLIILAIVLPKRYKIALLFAYVLFVISMTLLERRVKQRPIDWDPMTVIEKFRHSGSPHWEVIYNVILFIPLGAMIHSINPKLIWTVLALSICIEIIQYVFGLGECEVGDVLLNGAGCMIGFGMAWLLCQVTVNCILREK